MVSERASHSHPIDTTSVYLHMGDTFCMCNTGLCSVYGEALRDMIGRPPTDRPGGAAWCSLVWRVLVLAVVWDEHLLLFLDSHV